MITRVVGASWCFIRHPWRWWKVMHVGGNTKHYWCRVCGRTWHFTIPKRRFEVLYDRAVTEPSESVLR